MYEFTCKGANGIHELSLKTNDFFKFDKVMTLLESMQEDEDGVHKFCINDYRDGKYVMHLETQKMCDVFSRYLDSVGEVWIDGQSYLFVNYWDSHKERTGYNFNLGCCDSVYNYKRSGFTVLEFTDFDWSDYMEPLETFAPDPIV